MKQLQLSAKEFKEISIEDVNEPIVQYMYELIDICSQGVCFEIHRAIRLGHWELETIDDESQKEFEIVDEEGLDVFGQQPVKKQQECVCPNCSRTLAAIRFAPHLEKCMGMGRNSSRIASRRDARRSLPSWVDSGGMSSILPTDSKRKIQNTAGEFDVENDVDFDWVYEFERKGKKGKKEKDKDKEKACNSPKRAKLKKADSGTSGLATNGSSGSRPGTPSSNASGDTGNNIKAGPTLQALEALSREEKVALLTQTCGAISEHTGKMCTRTGRCVQHSDDQRIKVRGLLLGDIDDVPWPPSMRPEGSSLDQDDIHVDVDGYEDIDEGPLLRDLTPLSWEHESNVSTGSDTISVQLPLPKSPVILKPTKKLKGRKTRSR